MSLLFLQIKCNLLQAFVCLGWKEVHPSHSWGPLPALVKALSVGCLGMQSTWEGVSECCLECSLLCSSLSGLPWSLGGGGERPLLYQAWVWDV